MLARRGRLISCNQDLNFSKAKVSTIQNPTIRYFIIFLANTIFGRLNLGGMAAPEMCVLHAALHPHLAIKLNMGALMIAHFRKQKAQDSGSICCGGVITHIAHHLGIDLSRLRPVGGASTRLNKVVMINSSFMKPDTRHPNDHSYACPLVIGGAELVHLPLHLAFSVQNRDECRTAMSGSSRSIRSTRQGP